MANTYAPSSRSRLRSAGAPAIQQGYAVQDADGFWTFDTDGPAEAAVLTDTDGFVAFDTAMAESTWRVLIGSSGVAVLTG